MEQIKKYIEGWDKAKNPKPCNDPEFIKNFTEYLKESDPECWRFEGENHYCGYTAILHEDIMGFGDSNVNFEFAYCFDEPYGSIFVSVFTENHQGFWTPEYIKLKDGKAIEILTIIKVKSLHFTGFN